jgi:hypothetical protein
MNIKGLLYCFHNDYPSHSHDLATTLSHITPTYLCNKIVIVISTVCFMYNEVHLLLYMYLVNKNH